MKIDEGLIDRFRPSLIEDKLLYIIKSAMIKAKAGLKYGRNCIG